MSYYDEMYESPEALAFFTAQAEEAFQAEYAAWKADQIEGGETDPENLTEEAYADSLIPADL